jgi:hypothetical protein
MYEVIIDKCFKNNEQDLIQPFLREIRQLDLYKQAYGEEKSGFQQQEGPHFEEDREKLPKQKPTSPSWSHEGEKRQSHQAWEKEKKLGWQTRSEEGLLQGGEIGRGIATEAKQTAAALVAIVQILTQGTPSGDIGKSQVSSTDRVELTDPSSHHAHRAAHHQGWRCTLAPGHSPLDMACGAKELFQIIVGPRQIRDLIAVEEPIPIALRHLTEVGDCSSKIIQLPLLTLDHLQELPILLLKRLQRMLLRIGKQVGRLIDPSIG